MLGVMCVSAGIGELERILVSTLDGKCEKAARRKPFGGGNYDLAEIAEIDQTIARSDQIKRILICPEPAGDLSDFEPIVDVARAGKFNHLRREVHTGHAGGEGL